MSGGANIGQILKFGTVGMIGFAVDSGLLYLLMHLDLGPLVSRAISILAAMLTTWFINRNWSFGRSRLPWYRELATYVTVAGMVGLVNYSLYALILKFVAGATPFMAPARSPSALPRPAASRGCSIWPPAPSR